MHCINSNFKYTISATNDFTICCSLLIYRITDYTSTSVIFMKYMLLIKYFATFTYFLYIYYQIHFKFFQYNHNSRVSL